MRESDFQAALIAELKILFPGCIIQKQNANLKQGIPDILILYNKRWGALECKRKLPTRKSDWRPNQELFIERMNNAGFCRMICPENKQEVLHDLQQALRS